MNSDKFSEAIQILKDNNHSIRSVAIKLGINYYSLYNHIKGINRSFTKGRPNLLPYDVEVELINIASYLASRNLGLNLGRFKILANEIYSKLHPNVSEDNKPIFSIQWWKNLKQRHPDAV